MTPKSEKQNLSRVGKAPIAVPNGVTVSVEDKDIVVKGSKGELRLEVFTDLDVKIDGQTITVMPKNKSQQTRARHGLLRNLINNMVVGVSEGFKKQLEIQGVGYRVALSGKALKMHLGFSHEITYTVPENIDVSVDGLVITVSGPDKQLVGQTAANIRAFKKPEPYKGKGIRYTDEYVIRKVGKAAA